MGVGCSGAVARSGVGGLAAHSRRSGGAEQVAAAGSAGGRDGDPSAERLSGGDEPRDANADACDHSAVVAAAGGEAVVGAAEHGGHGGEEQQPAVDADQRRAGLFAAGGREPEPGDAAVRAGVGAAGGGEPGEADGEGEGAGVLLRHQHGRAAGGDRGREAAAADHAERHRECGEVHAARVRVGVGERGEVRGGHPAGPSESELAADPVGGVRVHPHRGEGHGAGGERERHPSAVQQVRAGGQHDDTAIRRDGARAGNLQEVCSGMWLVVFVCVRRDVP